MNDTLYEFEDGPNNILNYKVEKDDGDVIITVNDGDLGRIVIEELSTIEQLREALDRAESYLQERARRNEEL